MSHSVHDAIAAARRTLVAAGVSPAHAALDAEVLARSVLGWDRAALVTRGREDPPPGFAEEYARMIARRSEREPVAYITGVREFWMREFEVTRDVLIPRPETEFIVEEALAAFESAPPRTIMDVGTGSGCLAVTLALEFPSARVIGTDVSAAALAVARRNARRYGCEARLAFVLTDLLAGLAGTCELIVSNPPYLSVGIEPALQPEVARYEPREALYAGPDGLDMYRRLFPAAAANLAPQGRLVVEFGLGQEDQVLALAAAEGLVLTHVRSDLQGIPRVAVIRR